MNTELYEIYEAIAEISDGIREQKISFSYDRLMGVMSNCHPSDSLDMILPKIDWDSHSPDIELTSEALEELIEFNAAYKVKELEGPISRLKEFIEA